MQGRLQVQCAYYDEGFGFNAILYNNVILVLLHVERSWEEGVIMCIAGFGFALFWLLGSVSV